MAITVTPKLNKPRRPSGEVAGEMPATIDISNYSQGGETISASDFDLRTLDSIAGLGAASGFVFEWDESEGVIIVYEASTDGTALDEAAAGVDPDPFEVVATGL